MFPQVNKVLEYFLKNPTTVIHIRELARRIKVTPAGCLKSLKKLVKRGLIEEQKTKAISNYQAKLSPEFLELKKVYNLYNLGDSGLVNFLKREYEFPNAIVVFGSYARGDDTEQSDIDIAIITRLEKSPNLKKFENILQRKINLLELKNLKTAKKQFINNLINGTVIGGVLEL